MAWKEHYHRNCKWCGERIILGLCDDDVWRAYTYPPSRPHYWPVHKCHRSKPPQLELPLFEF